MKKPCRGKVNLLSAFCKKVSELHAATESYVALALAGGDYGPVSSARRHCEKLKTEASEIRDLYHRHDAGCNACHPGNPEVRQRAFAAFA